MSLRAADARLLAPNPIRRALLCGALPGWDVALAAAGVVVSASASGPVDLAVAAPGHATAAAASGATTVLSLRAAGRALRDAGYATTPVLVRSGPAGPRLLVPVAGGSNAAATHALRGTGAAWRRVAATAFLAAARRGAALPGVITVGSRMTGPPAMVAAAADAGLRRAGPWYLSTGAGDDLQRVTWFCFEPGATEPSWVVKGSRVRGHTAPLDRDQQGLALLDGLAPDLRRHATTVLGRFEVDGLPAAVETAAPGQPLHETIRRRPDALTLIARIAEWVIAMGQATAGRPDQLAPEQARIESDVLPPWNLPPAATALPPINPVVQHNDLGCWNIVANDSTFTVVDWESARRAGLPLWDLAYFLTDALSTLATEPRARDRLDAALALARGGLPESAILARLLARAAAAAGVPLESVGRVVTLGWLHHGLSASARDSARRDAAMAGAGQDGAAVGPLERLAGPWLQDPRLGVEWPAFLESAGR